MDSWLKIEIEKHEAKHEIVVSAVRCILIGFLGVLYLLAPKGFTQTNSFEPVKWLLILYFPLLCFRLYLAVRNRLSPVLTYLGIALDVIAISSLIYSFHIQYGQSPAFSLKAPTFIYFLLFIVLRSLSYNFKYVVTTGVLAALSWALLVGLAIYQGEPITHYYVEYLSQNKVLVRTEVDKILILLLATGLLAYGVIRTKKLLIRSVDSANRNATLSRCFSPTVLEQFNQKTSETRDRKN
jgi:adenylate cyclase